MGIQIAAADDPAGIRLKENGTKRAAVGQDQTMIGSRQGERQAARQKIAGLPVVDEGIFADHGDVADLVLGEAEVAGGGVLQEWQADAEGSVGVEKGLLD